MIPQKNYNWIETARRLQAVAQAGLEYCHNEFDRDRYRQIHEIAMEILEKHSTHKKEEIIDLFEGDTGYPTPKVDVRAVVFRENRILMIREKHDGMWALPGGWADPHLSLKENIVKESREEAGVEVIPERIIAVHDRRLRNYPPIPHGCYKIFVECRLLGGEFIENTETLDSGYFSIDELPDLSTGRNTREQIELCFKMKGNSNQPDFD